MTRAVDTWPDLLIRKHLGESGFGEADRYPAGHPLYERVRALVEEAAAGARRVALSDAERECDRVAAAAIPAGRVAVRHCCEVVRAISRWDGQTPFRPRDATSDAPRAYSDAEVAEAIRLNRIVEADLAERRRDWKK